MIIAYSAEALRTLGCDIQRPLSTSYAIFFNAIILLKTGWDFFVL